MGLPNGMSGGPDYSYLNPDPKKFILHYAQTNRFYTYAIIQYKNCTNYYGVKLLVYRGDVVEELKKLKNIDPHFLDFDSPIARFRPDEIDLMRDLFGFMTGRNRVRIQFGEELVDFSV